MQRLFINALFIGGPWNGRRMQVNNPPQHRLDVPPGEHTKGPFTYWGHLFDKQQDTVVYAPEGVNGLQVLNALIAAFPQEVKL